MAMPPAQSDDNAVGLVKVASSPWNFVSALLYSARDWTNKMVAKQHYVPELSKGWCNFEFAVAHNVDELCSNINNALSMISKTRKRSG